MAGPPAPDAIRTVAAVSGRPVSSASTEPTTTPSEPSTATTTPRETGSETFPTASVACTATATVAPPATPSGTSIGNCQGGLVSRAFSCPFTKKATVATPVPAPSLTTASTVAGSPRTRRGGVVNDSMTGASESRKTWTPAEPVRCSASLASTVIGLSCWSTSATPGTLNVAPAGLAGSPAQLAVAPFTVSVSSERSFTVPATVTVAVARARPPTGS